MCGDLRRYVDAAMDWIYCVQARAFRGVFDTQSRTGAPALQLYGETDFVVMGCVGRGSDGSHLDSHM